MAHEKYNEKDLDELIQKKLDECTGLPLICKMIENMVGKDRVAKRVKEIIINDNIHDVAGAMAQLESQMNFDIETA